MKIELTEHEGCFSLEFHAESLADAALLVRFGSGAPQEIRHRSVTATPDGKIKGDLVFAKSKRGVGEVR